jgi:phytoene dehydrogenase-like protein
MLTKKRVAVIGAGHNALVCACYLAREGHEVTVYEWRSYVSDTIRNEEM